LTDATEAGVLAARLARLTTEQRQVLARRLRPGPAAVPRDGRPLPASFFQERLWLVDQLLPGTAAYLVTLTVRLRGELDADLLSQAFGVLIARHEVLRTQLDWVDDRLAQTVLPEMATPLRITDLAAVAEVRSEVTRLLAVAGTTGFELSRAPLFRVNLIRLAERDHVLAIHLHHAITDGWSNGILLRELGTVYRDLVAGRTPALPPLRLQYADAAAWQRDQLTDERLAELSRYWTRQLDGVPDLLDLPTDRPRSATGSRALARHEAVLAAGPAEGLRALATGERTTIFAVLLAGLAATLSRWAERADIVIGSPRTGRTSPELEAVVGPFVNTVVHRLQVPAGTTVRQLVRQARDVVLGAQAHADLPFERLVELLAPRRDPAYNPVFQVNFAVGNFPREDLVMPGIITEPVPSPEAGTAKFDLALYVTETEQNWYFTVEYNSDLFDPDTVRRVTGSMSTLLTAAGQDPDIVVLDVPLDLPAGTGDGPVAAAKPAVRPTSRFVSPRDQWERDVAQVWSQVLRIDPVGATDDFFALGGHSMAGMLVIDLLAQRTGRRVPLALLLRNRTVETLASALRAGDTGESARIVVPLVVNEKQPGQPPLFCLHAAVGELMLYFHLARQVGMTRPVYGLQSDGMFRDGDPGELTLRQLAVRYADEIIARFPSGPYHLCGFSAAGRLCLAVADRLAALGRPMGAVVLLDTAPLGDVAPDPDLATVLSRWLPFAPSRKELAGLDRAGQISATLAAGLRAGDLPPNLDERQFGVLCRRLEFNARALAGYRDPRYPGPMTLFVSKVPGKRDIVAEWAEYPIGEVRVETVDLAGHMGFVSGQAVPLVAQRMAACMTAAEHNPFTTRTAESP
jgi:thioesterase domain-containing protein